MKKKLLAVMGLVLSTSGFIFAQQGGPGGGGPQGGQQQGMPPQQGQQQGGAGMQGPPPPPPGVNPEDFKAAMDEARSKNARYGTDEFNAILKKHNIDPSKVPPPPQHS